MVAISPLVLLLILAVISAVAITLVLLFRDNRLLFWCVAVALAAHVGAVVGTMLVLFIIARLFPPKPVQHRIHIAAFRKIEPPKTPEARPSKPAPQIRPIPQPKIKPPPPTLAVPKGRLDGSRTAKVMPKGKTLKTKTPGKSGPKKPLIAALPSNPGGGSKGGKVLTQGNNPDGIAINPDKGFDGGLGGGEGVGVGDIHGLGEGKGIGSGLGDAGGEGGEDAGDPEGHGKGPIPFGFAEGKINGRVYFMRLKHGSGAWNAYNDGTRRLLAFLNTYFKCEGDSRAITANEMRAKYMRRNSQPSFLYLYCDDSFELNGSEIGILRNYIAKGGFLFLDSRPDSFIREKVSRQLNKVLPGMRLAPISSGHLINSFLFRLSSPGVGENIIDKRNYGITQGGRLVVFYTMGNFSHLFSSNPPDRKEEYIMAQYQMGANVMAYGINKGNPDGAGKYRGANAKVTTQALQQMGLFEAGTTAKPRRPGAPGESVKVKRTPKPGAKPNEPPDEPDEIKVLDD